jgi:hypothetical protein
VELQDQYKELMLPANLQEHIEDEIGFLQSKSYLESTRPVSKNMQFDRDSNVSYPFIMGQPFQSADVSME